MTGGITHDFNNLQPSSSAILNCWKCAARVTASCTDQRRLVRELGADLTSRLLIFCTKNLKPVKSDLRRFVHKR
jgi:hypothetical protein